MEIHRCLLWQTTGHAPSGNIRTDVLHCHMAKNQTRRTFLRTAPLAAALATVPLSEHLLRAEAVAASPESFQFFTAQSLSDATTKLQANPGNDNLYASKTLPLTIVLTTEQKKVAKEFEYHEGRDHIVQITDGTTVYDLGGTPQSPHSTRPGEWLAPASQGAKTVTLHKGDMLMIPRGTPHKRSTETSVTFLLISSTGSSRS